MHAVGKSKETNKITQSRSELAHTLNTLINIPINRDLIITKKLSYCLVPLLSYKIHKIRDNQSFLKPNTTLPIPHTLSQNSFLNGKSLTVTTGTPLATPTLSTRHNG